MQKRDFVERIRALHAGMACLAPVAVRVQEAGCESVADEGDFETGVRIGRWVW
jgi:hypothetical protein